MNEIIIKNLKIVAATIYVLRSVSKNIGFFFYKYMIACFYSERMLLKKDRKIKINITKKNTKQFAATILDIK